MLARFCLAAYYLDRRAPRPRASETLPIFPHDDVQQQRPRPAPRCRPASASAGDDRVVVVRKRDAFSVSLSRADLTTQSRPGSGIAYEENDGVSR